MLPDFCELPCGGGIGHAQDRRRLRIAPASIDGRLIEERREAVVVALAERVELVVVAAAAIEGEGQPDGSGRLGHVHDVIDPVFLGDAAAFSVDGMIAQKGGGEPLFVGGCRQEVARNLPDGEFIPALVAVERADHPVAPRPHGAHAIALVAIGVRVAGGFHPIPSHALAIGRGSKESVDLTFPVLRRWIREPCGHFLRRGRQAGEGEGGAPQQGGGFGFRRKRQSFPGEFGGDEGVDGIPGICGNGGLLQRGEGPVASPWGTFRDPLFEDFLLRRAQFLVNLRGRHLFVGIERTDPLQQQTLGWLPRHDRGPVFPRCLGGRFHIKPQIPLPVLFVGTMAIEAAVGQQRQHLPAEIHWFRPSGGRQQQRENRPGSLRKTSRSRHGRAFIGTAAPRLVRQGSRPSGNDRLFLERMVLEQFRGAPEDRAVLGGFADPGDGFGLHRCRLVAP